MTATSKITLTRSLWAANCARLLGGITVGVGLGSAFHESLELSGSAEIVVALVAYLGVVATKKIIGRTKLWDAKRQYYRRNSHGMLTWAIVESIAWIAAGTAVTGAFLLLSLLVPGLSWASGRGVALTVVGICLLGPAVWFTVAVFDHPPELLLDDLHRTRCWICALILHSQRRSR